VEFVKSYLSLLLALSFAVNQPVSAGAQAALPSPSSAEPSETSVLPEALKAILVASRLSPTADNQATIEQDLEDEQVQRLYEMERDFSQTAVDPNTVDLGNNPRDEVDAMSIDNFIKQDPKYLTGLFARLLLFGRGKKLSQMITTTMRA